jgi:hypothetical protein
MDMDGASVLGFAAERVVVRRLIKTKNSNAAMPFDLDCGHQLLHSRESFPPQRP